MGINAIHRMIRQAMLATLCALLWQGLPPGHGAELDVHQIKARYIHNFLKYITWPGEAAQNSALDIGVLGSPSLKNALEDVLAKNPQGKPFQVVAVEAPDAKRSMGVVYVHETNRERVGEIISRLPKETLTIGEGPSFLARGGMMEFNLSEGKIRFSVNLRALHEAGFSVDAKLLAVAQEVRK